MNVHFVHLQSIYLLNKYNVLVIYSQHYEITKLYQRRPDQVTARSKEQVCGPSLPGIVDWNPACSTVVCLMSVCSECLVLSSRGLYNRPISYPDESYSMCVCVCVCVCVMRLHNNILHLQRLGRRSQAKKNRNIKYMLKYYQQISSSIFGNGF